MRLCFYLFCLISHVLLFLQPYDSFRGIVMWNFVAFIVKLGAEKNAIATIVMAFHNDCCDGISAPNFTMNATLWGHSTTILELVCMILGIIIINHPSPPVLVNNWFSSVSTHSSPPTTRILVSQLPPARLNELILQSRDDPPAVYLSSSMFQSPAFSWGRSELTDRNVELYPSSF